MKNNPVRFAAWLLLAAMLLTVPAMAVNRGSEWDNPYADVTAEMWSYRYIRELSQAGVLPESETFGGAGYETRIGFVTCLYALDRALGGKAVTVKEAPFEDVPAEDAGAAAVTWAKKHGVVNGISETHFAPKANLTREDICTILIRYANYSRIRLAKKFEPSQFSDSLKISGYARTAVAACQMAGIVNGYENGMFRPAWNITREECAAVLWRIMDAAKNKASGELVETAAGAYDDLYDSFLPPFDPTTPAGKEVDLSYFDNVAIVGDSVSLMLQYYCASTKALGNATFLCAGSLSATNALWDVSDQSVHPSYQGKKVLVEDGVAQSGAKIVYLMLGINNIGYGIDRATGDMVTLIDRILEKSPDVSIVIESVTPMAESSNILTNQLNNAQIQAYNTRMQEICSERGWYYVNVAEVVTDENGWLKAEYCSDGGSMGIHFTTSAAKVWVDYLKTHVPAALLN